MIAQLPSLLIEDTRVTDRDAALAYLDSNEWEYGQILCVGYLADNKPHMLVGIGVADTMTEPDTLPHYRIMYDSEALQNASLYTATVTSNGVTYDVTNTTSTATVTDPFEFKEIVS